MIKRIRLFLGDGRIRAIFLLFITTGLASAIIARLDVDWVETGQTVLALVFVGGTVGIVFSALSPFERGRWLGILTPAFGLVVIGLLFVPQYGTLFLGASVGWVLAAAFIFKPRSPMAYQQAVKHLRKAEYPDAVKILDELIKAEPDKPNHYRFRAELLRLWGKLDRARRDYQKMVSLDPSSAVAYNGLAEVDLQAGNYERAREAAQTAYQLAPDEWVAAYNLGMIEDRLNEPEAAIRHLYEALTLKVPDARHRLLIYVYLIRAHLRLGDQEAAKRELANLRKHKNGLREWELIIESDLADTLREVIEDDIHIAQALISGDLTLEQMAQGAPADRAQGE